MERGVCLFLMRQQTSGGCLFGGDRSGPRVQLESQGTDMNCKEAEKKIPAFLDDELDGSDLAEFVEHIEECPECKEELSIQFLVTEGMEQLERGNNFNLQEALVKTLDSADDRIRVNRVLRSVLLWLEVAVAAAIVAAVVIVSM